MELNFSNGAHRFQCLKICSAFKSEKSTSERASAFGFLLWHLVSLNRLIFYVAIIFMFVSKIHKMKPSQPYFSSSGDQLCPISIFLFLNFTSWLRLIFSWIFDPKNSLLFKLFNRCRNLDQIYPDLIRSWSFYSLKNIIGFSFFESLTARKTYKNHRAQLDGSFYLNLRKVTSRIPRFSVFLKKLWGSTYENREELYPHPFVSRNSLEFIHSNL